MGVVSQPLLHSGASVITIILLILTLGMTSVLCLDFANMSFAKYPDQKLLGTLAIQMEVTSRIQCGVVSKTKGYEGYEVIPSTGGKYTCSVYSAMTELRANNGTNTYLTKSGMYQAMGYYIYDGKLIRLYPTSGVSKTWYEAVQWCADSGLTMWVPKSSGDWSWMIEKSYEKTYGHIWIPMTDLDTEGVYKWVDGTAASQSSFVTWESGYGYSNSDTSDCVTAHRYNYTLKVHVASCTSSYDGIFCIEH